jgi:hypothetical protein
MSFNSNYSNNSEKIKYPEPEWVIDNTKSLVSAIENSLLSGSSNEIFFPVVSPFNGWWVNYKSDTEEVINQK